MGITVLTSFACLCCMNPHDRFRIVFAEARQNWRAFAYVMHLHENHYIKRAGVAGIRLRASIDSVICMAHSK
ncbi:hypothetical protein DOD48_09860 [Shigella flexneri]|nr:hypothetical protein D3W53_16445 [Escherichia coli]EGD8442566.1 hypothetical protein [Shigella flexneri]EGD8793639.1 hypothetical protein [Shigella flexneri]